MHMVVLLGLHVLHMILQRKGFTMHILGLFGAIKVLQPRVLRC